MSAPSGSGSVEEKQSQALTKFMRRASKVLRPKSNRNSLASQSDATGEPSSSSGIVLAEVQPKTTPFSPAGGKPLVSSVATVQHREEKARALFAKYGLKLEPGEWTTPKTGDTQWVEKKIVMRVHRRCHRCQTAFGSDKMCANCNHTRCKKCPRFPTKRQKEQRKEAEGAVMATAIGVGTGAGAIAIDPHHSLKNKPIQLSMPSRFNQETIRRDPVHRVRRTCHRCDTLFVGRATQCENCKHSRCPNCPRDPPKTKKYPSGYPGDVEETFPLAQRTLKPIRTRFRWECHTCRTTFIEHEKTCRGCKHQRCDKCPRHPPKKTKPPPHPDIVKSLEEKMGRMALSPTTAA